MQFVLQIWYFFLEKQVLKIENGEKHGKEKFICSFDSYFAVFCWL